MRLSVSFFALQMLQSKWSLFSFLFVLQCTSSQIIWCFLLKRIRGFAFGQLSRRSQERCPSPLGKFSPSASPDHGSVRSHLFSSLDHVVSGKWLRHLHLHVHQEHENTGETHIFKRSIVNKNAIKPKIGGPPGNFSWKPWPYFGQFIFDVHFLCCQYETKCNKLKSFF